MSKGVWLRFVAAAYLTAASASLANAADKNFNVVSGGWFTDGNWNPAGVPAAADNVTIPTGRTVTLDAPGATVATFTLAGIIQGNGNLTVTGNSTWSSGQMLGSGATNANGGLTLNNAGAITLGGTRTLNNGGVALWTGNNITIAATAVFNNLPSADFNIISGGDVSSGTFNNAGALTKMIGGTGPTRFTSAFNNTGSVTVSAGSIELDAGGTHSGGDFFVQLGAALQFGTGTHTLNMGATVSGAGTVDFGGGTTTFTQATYDITTATLVTLGTANFNAGSTITSMGTLSINGGTLNLSSGNFVGVPSLTLSAGTLGGSDAVSVDETLVWNGGSMAGSGVTNANGGLQIGNVATITLLDTRTLNVSGTTTWTGNNLTLSATAVFNNLGGSTFNIQTGSDISSGTFNNAGTIEKVSGTGDGITRFTGVLNNTGSIAITSGALELDGGGAHAGGSFSVAQGASLQFGGATHAITGTASIGGEGLVDFAGGTTNLDGGSYDVPGSTRVSGGTANFNAGVTLLSLGMLSMSAGTLNLSSSESIEVPIYNQTGGTLGGGDVLAVGGMLTWTGGTMGGAGVTNANGGMQINNPSSIVLRDTRTLNNAGLATWTGNNFANTAVAVFNNLAGATLEITTSGDFLGGRFNNAGTVNKSPGSGDGTSQFSSAFNNSGTLNANSGLLQFSGVFTQTAGLTRLGGGSVFTNTGLHLDGGRLDGGGEITGNVTNGATVAPGLSTGTLHMTGTYAQTAPGHLAIEIGGTDPSEVDQLAVAGVAQLGGSLDVSLIDGFVPNLGDSFVIMTFNSRTGDFAASDGLLLGGGRGLRKVINPTNLTLLVVQEICNDLIDNDDDGFVDCDDIKCSVVQACIGTPTNTRTPTPTVTPTPTITPTPSRTPTVTRTFTIGPSATVTRTPTLTGTVTPTVACVGDCRNTGMVSEADIETAIHALFDPALIDACHLLDPNGDGRIVVSELEQAILSRGTDCAPQPTQVTVTRTPTRTITPTAGAPTSTPGDIAPAVSGSTTVLVNALSVIPSLVTAVIDGNAFGGAGSVGSAFEGGAAGACPLGGTATRSGSFPFVSLTLNQCEVATADGSVTFTGTAGINFTSFTVNITAIFADGNGTETRRATAMLSGLVTPDIGGLCLFTAAEFTITSGTITVKTPDGTEVGATFQNTELTIDQMVFNTGCVPINYRMTFDGNAALLTPAGEPIPVVFTELVMNVDDSGDPTLFLLSGGLTSSCFGGASTLGTNPAVAVQDDDLCPTAGGIQVTTPTGSAGVVYNADGSVTLDIGGEMQTYPNCLDPRLVMCAA